MIHWGADSAGLVGVAQVAELERTVGAAELAGRWLPEAIGRAEGALQEAVKASVAWVLHSRLQELQVFTGDARSRSVELQVTLAQLPLQAAALRSRASRLPRIIACLANKHACITATVKLQPELRRLTIASTSAWQELDEARLELGASRDIDLR